MNWKDEIVKLVYLEQLVAEADSESLFPHHLPNVAAKETELADAARSLGYAIDGKYAAFLRHANGWDGFYQATDLFGTNDLSGSARMNDAIELLNSLEESTLAQAGLGQGDLRPIAATSVDIDLFCIGKPGSPKPGLVFWFAGTLIDTFPDFDEYFLSMVDYKRLQIDLLRPPTQAG